MERATKCRRRLCPRYSVYLLYWYKSTNTDASGAALQEVEERVARELLRAFEMSAGLAPNSIAPVAQRLQLWGAGVPMNVLSAGPCVLDVGAAAGICGDWLLEPSIQGAAVSGPELPEAIANHTQRNLYWYHHHYYTLFTSQF